MKKGRWYTCDECGNEEYWSLTDIVDGTYPEFAECEYCDKMLCVTCQEDHLCLNN